jgi:hypothetical protein
VQWQWYGGDFGDATTVLDESVAECSVGCDGPAWLDGSGASRYSLLYRMELTNEGIAAGTVSVTAGPAYTEGTFTATRAESCE